MKPRTIHPMKAPLLLLLFILPAWIDAIAQSPSVAIGIGGEVVTGKGSGSITVYPGSTECGQFSGAAITAFRIGAALFDRDLFGAGSGLSISLDFRKGTWETTTPAVDPLVVPGSVRGEILRVDREYRFVYEESSIELDARWRGVVAGPLGVSAGLGLGYRVNGTFQRTERIIDQSDFRFDSGLVERPLVGVEGLASSPLRLSGTVGIDLDIPIAPGITIVPLARLSIDPFGPDDQGRLGSVDLSIGARLLWSSPPPPHTPEMPPLAATDTGGATPRILATDPKKTRLTASVEIYGVDEADRRLPAATVTIYETISQLRIPPPRWIPFDRNSSAHHGRREQRSADRFDADSLTIMTSDQIEKNVLPLLADYLRRETGIDVRLEGQIQRGERKELATERARNIRDYLIDVQEIASERVTISPPTSEAQRGGVRVDLVPEMPRSVINLEMRTRSVIPPLLAIDREYNSDAGIRRWRIEIFHGSRRVGIFSSDSSESTDSSLNWDISPSEATTGRSSLVAELTVEDSAGTTARTRAPTPLIFDRPVRVIVREVDAKGLTRRLVTSLFPFPDGSAEVRQENRRALEETLDLLGPHGEISILLDAERGTGRTLTKRRGEEVRRALSDAARKRGWRSLRVIMHEVERNVNPLARDLPEGTRGNFEVLISR